MILGFVLLLVAVLLLLITMLSAFRLWELGPRMLHHKNKALEVGPKHPDFEKHSDIALTSFLERKRFLRISRSCLGMFMASTTAAGLCIDDEENRWLYAVGWLIICMMLLGYMSWKPKEAPVVEPDETFTTTDEVFAWRAKDDASPQ
jgi:hypothetical protein